MELLDKAYDILLWIAAVFLAVNMCVCLIRAIIGPRFTDRVVSVNIICTKTIILIAVLSFLLGDSAVVDIAIVYAMISFLAVVVLSKCYLLPHHINPADPDHVMYREEKEEETA